MPTALDAIVADLKGSDRQERIDILLDFAKSLPPLPERLVAHKDASHRVEECQSPVYLFVELEDGRVSLNADAPIEAPTVRGFVSLLLEGLNGATVEEILSGARLTWWIDAGWARSWGCSGCAGSRACSGDSRPR